jgi:CRISPR-associated protein Csd1
MILQALNGYYERMSAQADSRIAPPGLSYQPISFAIVLATDGRVVDIDDLRQIDGQRSRPRSLLVPQPPKRSGRTPPPCFLWDKTGYVFGMEGTDDEAAPFTENAEYRASFRDYHQRLLGSDPSAEMQAVLHFIARWQPVEYAALRNASEMIDTNVVFRLDGQRAFVHDSAMARSAWLAAAAAVEGEVGLCLVLGERRPIARLHPSIKGVQNGQTSGASIVSFNQDSFTSYGKEQGANAPVSEQAAFAYTTALNELLRRDSKQKVQIGDATTVYWAESDDNGAAAAAEQVFGFLVEPSAERADAAATDHLRTEVMERMAQGRPLENAELKLDPATRFYILGLSPNAARLSVRFWEATTLGALGEAFHQHWQDMRLEGSASRKAPPSIAACALRTAPARKDRQGKLKFSFDDIAPQLAGELMRSILNRNRYPGSLLATLVMRVRNDGVLDPVRVALIKATIVRAMRLEGRLPLKHGQPNKEYLVRTDPNDINPARRLGRLFAVLERAQLAALGDNINTTIKDKFLGAAAATPAQVFVGLIKNSQHHTKRLRNGHSDAKWIKDASHARRVGFGIERDVGRLWGSYNEGLPGQHSIEEQALFFVGYYQERFGGRPDESVGTEPGIDTTETPDDQE